MKKYLDISQWQTNVDYSAASHGLDGIILRAGYGKGHEDEMFRKHYIEFAKRDIPIGVYWFSYATNEEEAVNEARYCVSTIHGLKIELPVCFDFEDDSVKHAKTQGIKITKPIATKIADAFLSTIERNGYYAMLYANPNYLQNYYGDLSRYDLWLAHWGINEPSRSCGIWQRGAGHWNGFATDVDLDESYKDYPKIIRNAGLNHLPSSDVILPNWLEWATDIGLITLDELDKPATKGEIAHMLYECYFMHEQEDARTKSGLLGG